MPSGNSLSSSLPEGRIMLFDNFSSGLGKKIIFNNLISNNCQVKNPFSKNLLKKPLDPVAFFL
jgi:hypothetical protein